MSAITRVLGHPAAGALLGLAVLAGLVWRLGTGPVLHGLGSIGALPLAAALLIGIPVTLCCALRWSLVSRGLGVALSVRAAVAGCATGSVRCRAWWKPVLPWTCAGSGRRCTSAAYDG